MTSTVSIYAVNPDDSRAYGWVIILEGEMVAYENHVSADTMTVDLADGIYSFMVYNGETKVGTWAGTITFGSGEPESFDGVCYNASTGFTVGASPPPPPIVTSTWIIGSVTFPFSPSQISEENEATSENIYANKILGTGKGVRTVTISGSIAFEGVDKAAIETYYAAPLRAYKGTSQTIQSPSGAYDGDWLIKKVSFKEQAEGAFQRILYTITLWKIAVFIPLTSLWIMEYFDDPNWVPLDGKFSQSMEELKGHEQVDIILPNNSTNQTFVDSDQVIKISFDNDEVFTGTLKAFDLTATQIKCVLYNAVYEAMKAKTITADFTAGAPANTIFAAICTAAGVTAGACLTTTINVNFIDAECYMAAVFLSDVLNSDFSASSGTFNIAARGSLKTASHFKIQSRGIDRAKKRDKVRVRGVSIAGLPIVGEAGSGTNVVVKIEQKVSDVGSLSLLAAKYLADLNTDSKGAPLIFPITEAYGFHPGDTFAVTNLRYKLDGTYAMKRVTKTSTKVTAELDVAKTTIEQMLLDFDKYAEYGIYYISGAQMPATLNYQGLELFQLMNEGSDVFINDYAAKWHQGIGTAITWTSSFNGLACTFEGASFVLNGCDWSLAGSEHFSLSIWFNPSNINNESECFLAILPNNFQIYHIKDELTIAIFTGSGSTYHELTVPNACVAGVRKHLVVTYDGVYLKAYLNNVLVGSLEVTGVLSPFDSTWELCVGGEYGNLGFVGQLDTLLIFSRTIIESEINDLYRFSNLISPPAAQASNDLNAYNLLHQFHMNEGSGSAITDSINPEITGSLYGCSWALGESSPILEFPTSSAATIAGLTIGGTDKLAIGFWVIPEAVQNDGIVFSKAGEVEFRVEGGGTLFRIWIGSSMTGVSTTPNLFLVGKKYFVMATYDGTYAKLYVNGTERARSAISGTIDSGSSPSFIGGSDGIGSDGFQGVISELMIWRG